ncbi:MAG: DivIVA domain-containing protein [Desulfitobacteriaceae bacterium]
MNLERPDFKRVLRGYDRVEVEQSWAEISSMVTDSNAAIKEMKLQLNSLREQNTEWGNRLKNYEKMESDLRDALIGAQRIAKQVQEDAEHKAEELLSSAQLEVIALLNEAQEDIRKREEEANRQLLNNQIKISNMEDEIFELTSKKDEIIKKVERTSTLYASLQHILKEIIDEE